MITLWVISIAGNRPRRTHRWRVGDNKTICGIYVKQMTPMSTRSRRWPYPFSSAFAMMPKPCHVCFKHLYRHWSQG